MHLLTALVSLVLFLFFDWHFLCHLDKLVLVALTVGVVIFTRSLQEAPKNVSFVLDNNKSFSLMKYEVHCFKDSNLTSLAFVPVLWAHTPNLVMKLLREKTTRLCYFWFIFIRSDSIAMLTNEIWLQLRVFHQFFMMTYFSLKSSDDPGRTVLVSLVFFFQSNFKVYIGLLVVALLVKFLDRFLT